MSKKEREMCELTNSFSWCSSVSNDDIIPQRPGLISGMDFGGQV